MTAWGERTRVAWAALARLSLIVSLWHAPVPWVHQHSADAPDLTVHLATHHAHDHGEACGWHMHCELPLWGHTDDGAPTGDHSESPGRLFFDPAASPSSEIGPVGAVAVTTLVEWPVPSLSDAVPVSGKTFLQSLFMRGAARPVCGRCQC
jgi:hypothetical protein